VALASAAARSIEIVAVAYADAELAGGLAPEVLCHIAGEVGVSGILLDTCRKGNGHLLTCLAPSRLAALLASARSAGLLTAVAGGLGVEQLAAVSQVGPDIVGFRGAVCVGGREGALSEDRVRLLRRRICGSASGFVHQVSAPA
jgi:uncharacterized protein (UPF0264 family)